MLELLKQGQYQPMPVEEQVASIFAGVKGFTDDIPLPEMARFENEYLEHMRTRHAETLAAIAMEKKLSDELSEKLSGILKEFVSSFKLSLKTEEA
jgi:F-type H+-transporting ATPase subunit alpha